MKSRNIARPLSQVAFSSLVLSFALGCSQQPPKSLVDARQAVALAEEGEAAKYAPDELLEARKLLDRAEAEKSNSDSQKHLAYLADRQARLAESEGEREMHQAELSEAERRYSELQDELRIEAEAGFEKTKQELLITQQELGSLAAEMRSADADLGVTEARRKELETQQGVLQGRLDAQSAELSKSELARKAAEERASAAIASLKELAQVKEEANRTVVTLSGAVLFKTGESTLLPLARNALAEVATALKELEDSQVVVIKGHTDSNGADDMNQRLSQARAEAVRNYLLSEGVRASALRAVGKGEGEPIADNKSAEGRANNRRVEIVIPKGKQSAPASVD
jgi:outer membrane protein OmpA-like peptidoglycan-associated protein